MAMPETHSPPGGRLPHRTAANPACLPVALGLAGLALAAAGALLYESRQLGRPPEGNLAAFLAQGRRAGQRVVACLGASIVHGRISVDFVDLLRRRFPPEACAFVNAGVNGDLAYNVLQRLEPVIACEPDFAVILVGTNDANATLNPNVARLAMRSKHLPSPPSLDWYRANLAQIVIRLQEQTHARIALASLPVLGEDLAAAANQRIREFNAAIRQVAAEHGVAYLPVHERQVEFLTARQGVHGRPFTGNPVLVMAAGVQRYLLGQSLDAISCRNGLLLTTDLMHMNTQGATLIADQIEPFLLGN